MLSGDGTFLINGKEVARVGDQVSCPKCRGTFPIVTGAHNFMSGAMVARHGDQTACGAKLLASQHTDTWDSDPSVSSSRPASMPAELVPGAPGWVEQDNEPHAIRFQAINPETGEPIPRCVYELTRENGASHGGITDKEGYTETIETMWPEQIAVHFVFQSPKGDNISRDNDL